MLKISNLSFKYEGTNKYIFENLKLSFPSSGLYLVHGKSGCGKSTLLKIISGELKKYQGLVTFSDLNLDDNVAFVKQNPVLIENFSLLQNLKLISSNLEEINNVVEALDLAKVKKTKCYKLSSGQRTRVSLAISILSKKKILLLDEITAAIDDNNAKKILCYLQKLSKNILIICVSHQIDLFLSYIDGEYDLEKNIVNFNQCLNNSKIEPMHNRQKKLSFWNNIWGFSKYFLLRSSLLLIVMITFFLSLAGIYRNDERVYPYHYNNDEIVMNDTLNHCKSALPHADFYEKAFYIKSKISFQGMLDEELYDLLKTDTFSINTKKEEVRIGENRKSLYEVTLGIENELLVANLDRYKLLLDKNITYSKSSETFTIRGIYGTSSNNIELNCDYYNTKAKLFNFGSIARNTADYFKDIVIPQDQAEYKVLSKYKFDSFYFDDEKAFVEVNQDDIEISSSISENEIYISVQYLEELVLNSPLKTVIRYDNPALKNIHSGGIDLSRLNDIYFPISKAQYQNFISFIVTLGIGFLLCLLIETILFFIERKYRKDLLSLKDFFFSKKTIKAFNFKYLVFSLTLALPFLLLGTFVAHLLMMSLYPNIAFSLLSNQNIAIYLITSFVMTMVLDLFIAFIKEGMKYDIIN